MKRKPRRTSPCRREAASSSSSASDIAAASHSPSKRAISARPNSRIFFRPRSNASRSSLSWNGSIKWISVTRMRKLTPRLPITGLPIPSRSATGSLSSAFVRLSIPRKGNRSCTFWDSTDLNDTASWSGDSDRILSWWIWAGISDFRQHARCSDAALRWETRLWHAMASAKQNVCKKFSHGTVLGVLCRSVRNLQAAGSADQRSRAHIPGRFIVLWLTIFILCGPQITVSTESNALPRLPRLSLQKFLPVVREQVQQAYDAVVAHPRNAAANGKLGMVLQAYSQLKGAEIAYRRARYLAPSHFDWIYYLGQIQANQGNCDEAIKSLREALKLNPVYLPARLKLAECLRASAQWDESETLYRAILKEHPDSAEAYYGLGRVQAAQHDLLAAANSYRAACSLFPEFGAAHYGLALAYRSLGQEKEAQGEFQSYEKNKDVGPPARDPFLEEVRALNHGAANQIRIGLDLERAGKLREAAEAHEEALKIDPTMVQAHVNLISIYGRLKEPDKAEEHYQRAVQLAPDEEGAHYNYGVLLFAIGRYEEAETAFRKGLEINPS